MSKVLNFPKVDTTKKTTVKKQAEVLKFNKRIKMNLDIVAVSTLASATIMTSMPPSKFFGILERFDNGDWGEICEEDKEQNNKTAPAYALGVYPLNDAKPCEGDNRLWVIKRDNLTSVLLPEEY